MSKSLYVQRIPNYLTSWCSCLSTEKKRKRNRRYHTAPPIKGKTYVNTPSLREQDTTQTKQGAAAIAASPTMPPNTVHDRPCLSRQCRRKSLTLALYDTEYVSTIRNAPTRWVLKLESPAQKEGVCQIPTSSVFYRNPTPQCGIEDFLSPEQSDKEHQHPGGRRGHLPYWREFKMYRRGPASNDAHQQDFNDRNTNQPNTSPPRSIAGSTKRANTTGLNFHAGGKHQKNTRTHNVAVTRPHTKQSVCKTISSTDSH